jgi:hypothetical protein
VFMLMRRRARRRRRRRRKGRRSSPVAFPGCSRIQSIILPLMIDKQEKDNQGIAPSMTMVISFIHLDLLVCAFFPSATFSRRCSALDYESVDLAERHAPSDEIIRRAGPSTTSSRRWACAYCRCPAQLSTVDRASSRLPRQFVCAHVADAFAVQRDASRWLAAAVQ